MSKYVVVFDLDGTLSDGRHRLHLLPKKDDAHSTQAWDAFNLAAGDDGVFNDNMTLMNDLFGLGYMVVILTGRCDVAEYVTKEWLNDNGACFDDLIMRKSGDHRQDIEFKEEELRKIGLDKILCCFDDLERVAKHIRSLGVTCHLVTHYDDPSLSEKKFDTAKDGCNS